MSSDASLKDDSSSAGAGAGATPVPAYGSKEYWDQRYSSKRQKVDDQTACSVKNDCHSKCCDDKNEDGAEAEHAWYFTHDELLPLLEPLITDIHVKNQKGINVCEIGCGDVPLGPDLVSLLNKSDISLINRMVCSDYSKVVIDDLQKKHNDTSSPTTSHIQQGVEYVVADARFLSNHFISSTKHNQNTQGLFDMIIDKGTLDAMLSDDNIGQQNCKAIVKEVTSDISLSVGGCFIIVSHLNANTSTGMQWLQDIVIKSLSVPKEDLSEMSNVKQELYKWEIEVHGSSGDIDDDNDEDDCGEGEEDPDPDANDLAECCTPGNPPGGGNDEDEEESISPGPAVYVIKKSKIQIEIEDVDKDVDEDENDNEIDVSVSFVYY